MPLPADTITPIPNWTYWRRRSSVRTTPHLLSTSLHFSVPILATPPRPQRHVSDLSRSGWHDDDHEGHNKSHVSASNGGGGAGGAKDGRDSGAKDSGGGMRGGSNKVFPEPQPPARAEPNVINIALDAGAADCVQHVLDAVLAQKVTPGSYHAITAAIPAVAEQYPTMCQVRAVAVTGQRGARAMLARSKVPCARGLQSARFMPALRNVVCIHPLVRSRIIPQVPAH